MELAEQGGRTNSNIKHADRPCTKSKGLFVLLGCFQRVVAPSRLFQICRLGGGGLPYIEEHL